MKENRLDETQQIDGQRLDKIEAKKGLNSWLQTSKLAKICLSFWVSSTDPCWKSCPFLSCYTSQLTSKIPKVCLCLSAPCHSNDHSTFTLKSVSCGLLGGRVHRTWSASCFWVYSLWLACVGFFFIIVYLILCPFSKLSISSWNTLNGEKCATLHIWCIRLAHP